MKPTKSVPTLFEQCYGEISDINKETIYYIQKQLIGINRLLKSVNAPLKVVLETDFSKDKWTREQQLYFEHSVDTIDYFAGTSKRSEQ